MFFRDLLEENSYRLSDNRHMSDLIPFVLQQEQAKIKEEVQGKHMGVILMELLALDRLCL